MRLILTRHAKSSWDDPTMDDHDRPLNARGHHAAHELGDWLASRGYEPEEVLCSTATRTRETWEGIKRAQLEVIPKVRFIPELYHANSEIMLKMLQSASGHDVLMIGHNPGIAMFAERLPATLPNHPEFRKYPTAATLVVDFEIENWSEVTMGKGSARDFFRPTK